jgi:hypothetical protein
LQSEVAKSIDDVAETLKRLERLVGTVDIVKGV